MTCCWAPWGHPGGESGRAGTSRRQWPSPWPEAFFTTMTTTTITTTTARPHVFFMSPRIMVIQPYPKNIVGIWCILGIHHVHFFALALWNPSSLVTQAILAALWFLLRGSTLFTESEHSNLFAPKIIFWMLLDDLIHNMKGRPRIGRWACISPVTARGSFCEQSQTSCPKQMRLLNARRRSLCFSLLGFIESFIARIGSFSIFPNITQVP